MGEQFVLTNRDWETFYQIPLQVTKNTKLQWLQYRISHHILTTNSRLFKAGLVTSSFCNLCNSERETITHLLWECREVQNLLQALETLTDSLFIPFSVSKQSFLLKLMKLF